MRIGGFQKFSLSDFPGRASAIVFTQGCNFRCPWCHNGSLIPGVPEGGRLIDPESVIRFLSRRRGKLDGLVITGGEPTLQEELPLFTRSVKSLGYQVKLDTNGSNPRVIGDLLSEGLIDYIAMDIKAPFASYDLVTGVAADLKMISRSIDMIARSGIEHEFRTTAVTPLLRASDIMEIFSIVPPGSRHVIQKYRNAGPAGNMQRTAGREAI